MEWLSLFLVTLKFSVKSQTISRQTLRHLQLDSPYLLSSQDFCNGVLFMNSCQLIILLGGAKSGMTYVTILVMSLLLCLYRNQALLRFFFFSKSCFSLKLFFPIHSFPFSGFRPASWFESYLCLPLFSFFLPLPNPRAILNLFSHMGWRVLKWTLQMCLSPSLSTLRTPQTLHLLG